MKKNRALYIARAAIIAALYVSLTFLSSLLGSRDVRISEMLCVLPYFTAAAVPGLGVGCVLANLLTGCALWDVALGSLATLLGAAVCRALRKKSWLLAPWPNIIANTLIVPIVLQYVYFSSAPYWLLAAGVGAGEVVTAGAMGYLMLAALRRRPGIFQGE